MVSRRRDRITDEAAIWFVRAQDSDFSRMDREEFASWLAASAEHVLEFLSLAAVTRDIRESAPATDVDALLALASDSADVSNVVRMLQENHSRAGPARKVKFRRRTAIWVTAASVLIAATAGIWLWQGSPTAVFSTGTGEQISFPLPDGSLVILNARSTLEVEHTPLERNARLTSGEALFKVEEDAGRPFTVLTDRAAIRAVGTSFNVRHRNENTTVTVIEGRVDIRRLGDALAGGAPRRRPYEVDRRPGAQAPLSKEDPDPLRPVRVGAGYQARVHPQTAEIAVFDTIVENAISWRERRLVFESRALSSVLAEFNLYSNERIVIENERLGSIAISGSFNADDPESFALFLSEAGLAVADQRADGVITLRLPRGAR